MGKRSCSLSYLGTRGKKYVFVSKTTLNLFLVFVGLCGVYDANKYNDARSKDGTLLSLIDNIAPQSLASSWR